MFTDIAGYTEAMSQNEQKALQMLRKKRSIIKPLIDSHNGTYVKEIGDGTLSYLNLVLMLQLVLKSSKNKSKKIS